MRSPLVRLALVFLLLAGCDGRSDDSGRRHVPVPTPTRQDALVVGLVGTMTGAEAWRGEDAYEGADLGVHILNRDRARGETRFELATLDDRGDPARARQLLGQLAVSERTVGIVYAGPPEALLGSEDILAAAGIPAILVYGDLYGARKLSRHLFQASPSLVWQARRIAAYLVRDRRYERVGALISETLSGDTALKALRVALADRRAGPPIVVRYPVESADLRPALERLRARGTESVVVEGAPRMFGSVSSSLREMGARYRSTPRARIVSAPRRIRRARLRSGYWHPQLIGFDLAIRDGETDLAPGTVASDTYARGVHYLPVPSFGRFRSAFVDWWDLEPRGWENRAFEATRMIGWAVRHARPRDDLVRSLERMRAVRFGGLPITLGPDDHTAVDSVTVGLWTVPARRDQGDQHKSFPWMPLARGFSIDGVRTDIPADDWRYLFRRPPPRNAPAPRLTRMRFAVATPRSDSIH